MTEQWKSVIEKPFSAYYEVSNLGNVRSLRRNILLHKTKALNGYYFIGMHAEGKHVTRNIHRLVAQAFIPNPDNLPEVNHKDEDKSNNCVTNLEWCTRSYNCSYGINTKKARRTLWYYQYSLDGVFLRKFTASSLKENGFDRGGCRIAAKNGGTFKGFHWHIKRQLL